MDEQKEKRVEKAIYVGEMYVNKATTNAVLLTGRLKKPIDHKKATKIAIDLLMVGLSGPSGLSFDDLLEGVLKSS